MILKMEVYSPELELLGILETYDSLIVHDWAFESGSFSLESIVNNHTNQLLVPDNILWFYGDTAGIIEYKQMSMQEDGNIALTVKGSLLDGILNRRVLWGMYNFHGSPSEIMHTCVQESAIFPTRGDDTEARKIPNLVLDDAQAVDTRKIRKQSTGAGLYRIISEIAKSTETAFGVRFDAAKLKMIFWTRVSTNRTIQQSSIDPVLYSTELDDVLTSEYSYDSSEYKNFALVAGEGEGDARTYTTVQTNNPTESVLPEGYTQIEYVSSDGKSYIDVGYKPNSNTRVLCDVVFPVSASAQFLFGARNDLSLSSFSFLTNSNGYRSDYSKSTNKTINEQYTDKFRIDKNKNITSINGEIKITDTAEEFSCDYTFLIFSCNSNGTAILPSIAKVYTFKIYENDALLMDLVPCRNDQDEVGLYDIVGKQFYSRHGGGMLAGGPEVTPASAYSGLMRREMFIDARDLQKNADAEKPMTDKEYLEALKTRGNENLADNPLVQSFSATVRTINPTYEYEKDFFLGDIITVTDERLNLSIDAVVEGIERSFSASGEDFALTLGYSLPTLSDKLRKAGV